MVAFETGWDTFEKNFGFHGMVGTSGTKMGKIFEVVAECQRALNPMHNS